MTNITCTYYSYPIYTLFKASQYGRYYPPKFPDEKIKALWDSDLLISGQ